LAKDPAVSRDVESEQKKKTFTELITIPVTTVVMLPLHWIPQLCCRNLTACVKKADIPDRMQIGGRKKRHPESSGLVQARMRGPALFSEGITSLQLR
jgi:hypothetical protein